MELLEFRDSKNEAERLLFQLVQQCIYNEIEIDVEDIDIDSDPMWSISILLYPELFKCLMLRLTDISDKLKSDASRIIDPQKATPRSWEYFIKIAVPARVGIWKALKNGRVVDVADFNRLPMYSEEYLNQNFDSNERALIRAKERDRKSGSSVHFEIERELMQARGFPYEATFTEYIRFLDNNFSGVKVSNFSITFQQIKELFIPSQIKATDFQRGHTYIVGRSGSGKSELIKKITEKINGHCVVIDPHGDLADDICKLKTKGQIYRIAPHEKRFVINPFYIDDKSERNRELVAQEITDLVAELVEDSGLSRLMTTIIFPIIYTLLKLPYADFRMLTECINPNTGKARLRELRGLVEPHHRTIWQELENDTYDTSKQSVFNRLQSLLNYRLIVQTLCGVDDFTEAIQWAESGAVLSVSLPIPVIGEAVAVTLGRFFMTRMQIWAKRRQELAERDRIPVCLIVDEFHNFLSQATAQTLDQYGRKFKLFMILAHQHIQQITDREIRGSILANTVNKIAGMSNSETRQSVAKEMQIEAETLENLRPGHFVARLGNREAFELYSHMVKLDRSRRIQYFLSENGAELVDGWDGFDREQNTRRNEQPTQLKEKAKPKFDI